MQFPCSTCDHTLCPECRWGQYEYWVKCCACGANQMPFTPVKVTTMKVSNVDFEQMANAIVAATSDSTSVQPTKVIFPYPSPKGDGITDDTAAIQAENGPWIHDGTTWHPFPKEGLDPRMRKIWDEKFPDPPLNDHQFIDAILDPSLWRAAWESNVAEEKPPAEFEAVQEMVLKWDGAKQKRFYCWMYDALGCRI